MIDLLTQLRWQDAVDITVIAIVVYKVSLLIRGTRAVQMLIGLAVLIATYLASQVFELYTLNWILDNFLSSILLIIVILFQHDIRRALTQVGRGPFWGVRDRPLYGPVLEQVTQAVTKLARRRVGALVVFERTVGLSEYLEAGNKIDAEVSMELIESIFHPAGPLHDGALMIRNGRIAAAGCILPLTTNPSVSKALGTRHRAAIGVTEETDAVVIVVSEEGGTISLVRGGRITQGLDADALHTALQQLFTHEME
jgi:diadenylate cyclase